MANKVMIAHARGDEKGGIKGGKPGDQTGKEVCKEELSYSLIKYRFFIAKDAAKAELMAQCMEDQAENPKVGYAQDTRSTLWNAVKDNGFKCDVDNLKTLVNTDCSMSIRVAAACAGIILPNFNTESEPDMLLDSGEFEEIKITSKSQLKRGMIGCTKVKGHTFMVILGYNAPSVPKSGYKVGKVYTLSSNMNVRKGPGASYARKKRSQLTANGKKHAKSGYYGVLKKGTKVTCKKVVKKGNDIWLEVPSGYVCAKLGSKVYIV